eukprot:g26886.t1
MGQEQAGGTRLVWDNVRHVLVGPKDPEFVGSTFIRADYGTSDDDKLYFFFSETAREFEYYKVVRVPRVARVCKTNIRSYRSSNITGENVLRNLMEAWLVSDTKISGTVNSEE